MIQLSLAHRWTRFWLAVIAGCLTSSPVFADQSAEGPRETPLSPEAELATFELADERLSIELVACEPQLDSPVAISWDADGRMFVAEMIDYPLGPTAGRIRMLEDRDGDGRYEHATVFAEKLRFPNGVLAVRDGVLVTAAPDILFLKDNNGDGRADVTQVVLTGFGEGNQQLRANGLTWGLDNWIYGANGRSDGSVRRGDDPADAAVSIRGRDFRFRPDGQGFEGINGSSQFGQTSDDWGNRFVSWNTIPIRHVLFDRDFVERNPYLADYSVRDIADPSDLGQVFPISPRPKTFNRERTDYYNALCGLTIYRGDALGSDYSGSAFVGESLTNLVHRRVLTPEGPTFVSRRGEHGREFLASRDPWFHPVYLATGPDGALYVVDFYRRWVEHPAFVAESLRQGVDWRQGAGHGRIWKVSRREKTWPPRQLVKMSLQTVGRLTGQLTSTNGWTRDTAHRLLVERSDKRAAPQLRALVADSPLAQAKVHALSVLESLGLLDDGTIVRALEDGEPRVRRFALCMAAARMANSRALATAVLGMADFPNPLVRFQLPATLRALAGPAKTPALVKLAELEYADPLISLAIAGNLHNTTGEFLGQLFAKNAQWRSRPDVNQLRFLTAAATIGGADARQQEVLFKLIAPPRLSPAPGDLAILRGVNLAMAQNGQSMRAMLAEPAAELRSHQAGLTALVSYARRLAPDLQQPIADRLVAIEVLGALDESAGPTLVALLGPDHAEAVQLASAAALVHPDAETATAMFARWQDLTTSTRRAIVNAALHSRPGTQALVKALEDELISLRELDGATREALRRQRDEALVTRIQKLLASTAQDQNRKEVVARFESLAERTGNRARGAAVFEKQCLTCHTVQGRGHRVGPDLSGIASRPKLSLVADIFDPSRELAPNFAAYTLVTRDGQVLTGLIASETAASVTLRRAEGAQDIVPRGQIEELRGTGKSLMPEGLESVLTPEDVVDLLEFLGRPEVALLPQSK